MRQVHSIGSRRTYAQRAWAIWADVPAGQAGTWCPTWLSCWNSGGAPLCSSNYDDECLDLVVSKKKKVTATQFPRRLIKEKAEVRQSQGGVEQKLRFAHCKIRPAAGRVVRVVGDIGAGRGAWLPSMFMLWTAACTNERVACEIVSRPVPPGVCCSAAGTHTELTLSSVPHNLYACMDVTLMQRVQRNLPMALCPTCAETDVT
jgi:hypothetical protein